KRAPTPRRARGGLRRDARRPRRSARHGRSAAPGGSPVRAPVPPFGRAAKLFHRFRPLVAPHGRTLAGAAACMIGFIAMNLMTPWPVAVVIDAVLLDRKSKGPVVWLREFLPQDKTLLLAVCCAAVVVFAVLRGLFSYGENLLTALAGHRVVSDLRVAIFNRMQRLSLRFHSQKRTGDLMVRLTGDVSMLREILVPAVLDFASETLMLSGMLAL